MLDSMIQGGEKKITMEARLAILKQKKIIIDIEVKTMANKTKI